MIAAIIAVSDNGAIGNNGKLPWPRIDEDMAWFRKHTKFHSIIMGRKTWDSLPDRPLPTRTNIVCSRSGQKDADHTWGDLKMGLNVYSKPTPGHTMKNKFFIIGGKEIYEKAWKYCDKILLTRVHGEYEGDTFVDMGLVLGDFTLEYTETHSKCTMEIWTRDERIPART